MDRIAALVVRDSSFIQFAGLDLAERASRLARRGGIKRVMIASDHHPFVSAPAGQLPVVIPERVVLEPAALRDLIARGLRRGEDAAVLVDPDGESTDLLVLSAEALARVCALPRV